MENTKFIYTVNSDLDDELLYAEFNNKEAAIEYAKSHLDKLPFVDEVELAFDAEGIEDAISYKTIWDHTEVEAEEGPSEEDYWDSMAAAYEEEQDAKYDLGDTTWFESVNTESLVETMEENEDEVECKECFELFPKADCIKLDIGYICPTCADAGKLISVSDEDTFKVDFPEYEKFNAPEEYPTVEIESEVETAEPEMENENDPISTPEEAVPFLVKDEVEAIAGYEKAAEVVENSDLENKEEILDTLEHIKEEEEEHIEELQELVDTEEDEIVEVENEPISDEAKEVEETAVDVDDELIEHVLDRAEPIESDQELEGTDNAVVKCKVADVVTHCEDEKPVDCKGEKKTLDKVLTEDFNIAFKNQEDWDEFKRLCDEIGIVNMGDVESFMRHEGANSSNILDVLRDYRAELGPDFKIVESLYNFTEEEMTEYNMDEDGNSLDSYDEYVRCGWCGEIFTKDQCEFEANMGWLCDRCYEAIISRGEKLTIIKNPTEEEIIATLTEAKKMTRDEMIAKEGTDDVDLINAGREEEDRVELVEDTNDSENEPVSNDPGEKPSKPVKMANTAGTSGMDFEAACKKYGIELGESLEEAVDADPDVQMPFSDLSEDEQEYIKAFTKFINDTVKDGKKITADDIKEFRDNYVK